MRIITEKVSTVGTDKIERHEIDIDALPKFEVGKELEEFRNYDDSGAQERVERHYLNMRSKQTVAFVKKMHNKWLTFDKAEMTILEGFEALKGYVDASDPDSDFPNLEHMLQTAEAIRKRGLPDWMQLTGLLHDMGKIMYMWGDAEDGQEGTASGDQWALGGDTWVVGCKIPSEGIVFTKFNDRNPDMHDERYNTKYGMYEPNCGMMNVNYAFGHDEYMYQMLKFNRCTIPEEGMAMIRLHSCYPWHQGKNYKHLMKEGDEELMKLVTQFNQFDLYTKADERPDVDTLWPYYQSLIDKYCPGKLKW